MEITVFGYYGVGNLGDDWMLSRLLEGLGTPEAVTGVNVVGFDPDGITSRFPVDACDIQDTDRIMAFLERSKALVIGGGSLVRDSVGGSGEGREARRGGLTLLTSLAFMARASGTPYHFVSIGVDPIVSEEGRNLARMLFSDAASVTVRDPESIRNVLNLCPEVKVAQSADISFVDRARIEQSVAGMGEATGEEIVCVLRNPGSFSVAQVERCIDFLWRLHQVHGLPLCIVTFQNENGYDAEFVGRVVDTLRQNAEVRVFEASRINSPELLGIFWNASFIVTARYHALILGLMLGRPCFALDSHPKLRRLLVEVGLERFSLPWKNLRALEADRIGELLETSQNEMEMAEEKILALTSLAERNLEGVFEGCGLSGPVRGELVKPAAAKKLTRVLFVGGYWMKDNDVVSLMYQALADLPFIEVLEFCTDDHLEMIDTHGRPYDRGFKGLCTLKTADFSPVVDELDPDVIVLTAGGLALEPEYAAEVRKRRILVGISLSDPDVFPLSVKPVVSDFDLFFTNAYSSLPEYRALGVDAGWLPFACHPFFHQPYDVVEKYECDACLLGHARPDRVEFIETLQKNFDVRVYGLGWEEYGITSMGTVNGTEFLRAASSAKISLNFPRTMAGYTNVKVGIFETIASGAPTMTAVFDEMARFFRYEEEVIGYNDVDDMQRQAERYLSDDALLDRIKRQGFSRCYREHNWYNRWFTVLRRIERFNRDAKRIDISFGEPELRAFDFVGQLKNPLALELLS